MESTRPRSRLTWLLPLLAALAAPHVARANGFQISPVLIELQPGQMATTLTVTNGTADAASVQIRPFKWAQTDGAPLLTPTEDLALSPPITQIAAGQTQIFRIVLRRPATGTEVSYRLLLDQLPPMTAPGTVRVALRVSIPVFAEPPERVNTELQWRVVADRGGAVLRGSNHGGKHIRVVDPVLIPANGTRLATQSGSDPYILPGSERSWPVTAAQHLRPGDTLHLVALSDTGPVDATIHVTGP